LKIDEYGMDLIPAGPMIVLRNEDRPGMVGRVGTIFGNANANIADFALSRGSRGGSDALMVIKLDTPPSDPMMDQLRAMEGIHCVASIQLPPFHEKDE
jgi:D-3-phosphoglycerate dehydrogenase